MPDRDHLLLYLAVDLAILTVRDGLLQALVIERAHGCTLVDIDGRGYLDGVSSMWCNLHGHRHPKLDAALRNQLDRVAHVTNLGSSNPTTIELAKQLVEIAPPGLNHVFFSDDGATAIEVALKMAFQYWRQRSEPRPEKTLYVALGDAYHGDTMGGISIGGVDLFTAMFQPLLFDVIRVPMPDMYRLPTGVTSDGALAHYLGQLESALAEHHQRIAALVIEPLVQCAAGIIVHPTGYLRGVRELCTKYNVLLIADEIAVGFGRTGKMFACEYEEVTPDFLCLAKGITGGYLPLAATLATDEVWQAFLGTYAESKTFYHGHTYGGNPRGAAVALANLRIFEEEQTLKQIRPKIARLTEHLARISRHSHVGNVRQCGLIAGVELVRDKSTKEVYRRDERIGWRVCQSALVEGVFIRPLGNVVVIMPPLAISHEELDRICNAVERGIEAAASSD
jgi:adenosylmethionine-8-amino-7-oxononanoate aminotransferase